MRQLVLYVVSVSELCELTKLNDDADGLLSQLLHDLGCHALKLLHILVVPRARGKLLIRLVSLTDQTDEPIFTLGKILNEVEVVLELVDEDTEAFNRIMAAWKADEAHRAAAIQDATCYAIEVPLRVMRTSLEAMGICEAMAEKGMEASLSDAAVGALCIRTAVLGAGLNVRINAQDLEDEAAKAAFLAEATSLEGEARSREQALIEAVGKRLG